MDIVERLRFLASGQDDPHSVELTAAADEIERLREALREIRDFDTFENISNEECMRDIARDALGEKE